MTKLPRWKRSLVGLGVIVTALAALAGRPREGNSAEPLEPAQDFNQIRYLGSKTCLGCHSTTTEATPYTYARGFIKFNEYPTWATEDKHTRAYQNLLGPRARGMEKILGQSATGKGAGCLGCHSASPSEEKDLSTGGLFNVQEGVSCENCHGPSSVWSGPHSQQEFFKLDFAGRAKIGMFDMRKPEHQARNCLSCHIGSVEQGKVVTHKMYAAGHPPLPSIEVATFSDKMPRHWWLPSEKPSPIARAQRGSRPGDLDGTKLAIVGAAEALRTSMKLIADEARSEAVDQTGREWPDYARFDCWSCHHDLKRDGWRQARGYKGPPGRVPLNEWPIVLVELGIERLALDNPADKELKSGLELHRKALQDEIYLRPFGKRERVARTADEFARWSDVLIRKLSAATFNADVSKKLLRILVDRSQDSDLDLDFDTARHLGWAVDLLVKELQLNQPVKAPLEAILVKLRDGLDLKLPSGREYEIEDHLAAELEAINNYDPTTFRQDMKALGDLLVLE